MTDLFSPVSLGSLTLANRVVMAPMTRSRATAGGIPGALNAEYYAQRASAGLIISEATNVSPQARGFAFTPGIFNQPQTEGWRLVTDAVHAAGGKIICQLWHVGRVSHPSLLPNGALPVAPSPIQPDCQAFTEEGFQPCPTPRSLSLDEIAEIHQEYSHATRCAREAGFDGVEILAGGGYLIDQFLKDKTNCRSDGYGGSLPHRVRFMTEVVQAVVKAWSADRVGIRVSPLAVVNDIADSDPEALFGLVVQELNRFRLAYLHVMESTTVGAAQGDFDFSRLRRNFQGVYIANAGYDLDLAIQARQQNTADLVAFGRPFIANPDLVERLASGAELAIPDPGTFYGGDAQGYTDYPALAPAWNFKADGWDAS